MYFKTQLPEACEVNASLLNAPIYVLSDVAAKKLDCIEVKWKKQNIECIFRFIRAATDPFPTPIHAKYLDILLAMFADNWNESGKLYFRYCDVLAIAGHSAKSSSSNTIRQAIQRYRRHITEWVNCWNIGVTENFSIIRKSSILDENGNILPAQHNPRRAKKSELLNWVEFDQKIVLALKNENSRYFLTDLYKHLNRAAYCVYRYYYGYPDYYVDSKGQKRPNNIWRAVDQLREIFKWTGQKSRFLIWLEDQLEELYKLKLIDKPIWNENKTAVCIHCRNLEEIRNNTEPTTSQNMNQTIVEEYYIRKSKNKIPADIMSPIDLMLANPALIESAVTVIKNQVLCL